MLKNREELEYFYNELVGSYEGYIQMSDSRIDNIFVTATGLPKWENLHNTTNYILEMALFEPKSKNSILIRQHNHEWLVLEKKLDKTEPVDTFFTIAKDTPKMKIAQIWEEEKNEFCNNLEVLEAKYLMFAGFEKGDKS